MGNNGVSIIICCYNSGLRLPETIKHIAAQKVFFEIPWELIIVDNLSTDNTSAIALNEIRSYESLISRSKIVYEPNAGLTYARNKGVNEAIYEYIIFCDDDNWLDEDYINIAYSILSKKPKIAACGGQSHAISEVHFPDWWQDYKSGYAVGRQAELTGDISARKYLWGSGLAFKKELYLKAFDKLPSLLSDRKGKDLSSGGDSEICMRFLLMGYTLYYDERLRFKHYIDPSRLIWSYRKKLFQGFLDASVILSTYAQYLDILRLSKRNRLINLFKNTLKICLAVILGRERFYTVIEANFIFFCTGISLKKTSPKAKSIKKIKLNALK